MFNLVFITRKQQTFIFLVLNKIKILDNEACNFYLFATEQVYLFWLQKGKQRLRFFKSPQFVL